MKIEIGDFVVTRDRWQIAVMQVIRITPKTIFYIDSTWGRPRERRMQIQDALFAGSEDIARRLCEQLTSSYALKVEEQRKASERHKKRDEGFIAAALARQTPMPDHQSAIASHENGSSPQS